uniref:HAUS augmin-like complex subunit 3 N-terminal domain-containing protein n=1 Tax=Glossina palpalis gambiensis TaxID=67801 RepID=A0A1B0BZF0_9MUSC
MGDIVNNIEIFKRLNFDTSNQWIFYDERFHKFFDFFTNNITDSNILTETEVLEQEELLRKNQYVETNEKCAECLQKFVSKYPGLLIDTEDDIISLRKSIDTMEKFLHGYDELINDMRDTKQSLNADYSKLEEQFNLLVNKERNTLSICQSKVKRLEELHSENFKKNAEVAKMFATVQSPPLFMHQLSLDQYFSKSDSFMRHFSLYLKQNFKFQESEFDNSLTDLQEDAEKLNSLKKLYTCNVGTLIEYYLNTFRIEQYEMDYFVEKARGRGTQGVVDGLDLTKIHVVSLSDMERETHELAIANAHQEIVQKTLMVDLENLVRQQAQHIIEMNLYENTKEKLGRAQKRHQNNSILSQVISNVLSNAELIWIGIQLDLEKKHNRFDNSEGLKSESQLCLQRIHHMRNAASNTSDILSVEFITKMIQHLSLHLQHRPRDEVKACLHEYEKFMRLFNYALSGLLSRKHYATILEKLEEINHVETVLRSFVYDGPVDTPMFENVSYLKPIFNANMKKELIDKQLRQMRTQFHENVIERMEKDKLWRYRQLLWMWFLRDPSRVLRVIEEIKKMAAKAPQILKTLGGIKRK